MGRMLLNTLNLDYHTFNFIIVTDTVEAYICQLHSTGVCLFLMFGYHGFKTSTGSKLTSEEDLDVMSSCPVRMTLILYEFCRNSVEKED